MPIPDEPSAPPPLQAHERILRTARAHPWTTIAGIAAFAASLASAWPVFTYISHYYYTAADAQAYHDEVERRLAWGEVRDLRSEVIASRTLVNECRIKHDAKEPMSAMERRVCDQYEYELTDAQRRYAASVAKANRLSSSAQQPAGDK